MPADAFPILGLIISAFVVFIVVVGGVSIWCETGGQPDDPS